MEAGVMEAGVMEAGVMEAGVMEAGVMEAAVMDAAASMGNEQGVVLLVLCLRGDLAQTIHLGIILCAGRCRPQAQGRHRGG
jgi:hypothetical protein